MIIIPTSLHIKRPPTWGVHQLLQCDLLLVVFATNNSMTTFTGKWHVLKANQLHAWETFHCEHISSHLLLDCICSSIKTTAFKERQLFHLLSFIFGCVALFWDLHTCAYMEHHGVRASARPSAEQSRNQWHDGMKGGAGVEGDCKANEPLVVAVMLK